MSDSLTNAQFALPTDGRQREHLCEKRRLLHCYLKSGPNNFYKAITTIAREMSADWPDMGWSPRTVDRILADLQKLGLQTPSGRRGSQGTRIRRINKGYKREDGTPTASQGRRIHRKKIEVQREDGASTTGIGAQGAKMACPQAEDGASRGAKMAHKVSLNSYSKKEGGFSLNRQSSSEGEISKEPKTDDAERDFQPNGKLSPKLLAWAETQVLARAEDPIRNQHAFLRASLPEFLANLDMEVQRWLTETLGKWITQELHKPRLNPNIPAIIKPYEIQALVHGQVEKYDLPITETQVSIAVQSCIDRLGLKVYP